MNAEQPIAEIVSVRNLQRGDVIQAHDGNNFYVQEALHGQDKTLVRLTGVEEQLRFDLDVKVTRVW